MAEVFTVTREMVQELAETGSVQVHESRLSIPTSQYLGLDIDGRSRYPGIEELPADLAQAGTFACELFRLAGHSAEPSIGVTRIIMNSRQRVPLRKTGYTENDFHIDGTSATTASISMLKSIEGPVDEHIVTAGRGDCANPNTTKKFYYRDGVVILAGYGFGQAILGEDRNLGDTHHEAFRSVAGKLLIIDFELLAVPA